MDLATISANGQITVPADVRRALRLGPGDKIAFVTNELGDITVVKPLAAVLIEAQRSFAGAAAVEAGLESEADVDRLVAEVRSERRQSRTA
jgi:AbrB family looped-hinge helix DNA binding protein